MRLYSEELGIKLRSRKDAELFKWFLAAILFGARISQTIAAKTYKEFERAKVLTPDAIIKAGWHRLVKILDAGGYVRYDFSTADDLLAVAKFLKEKYHGSLNSLHEAAADSKDLEARLQEFRGVGPTTTAIFLRELRGVWKRADPPLSPLAARVARELKIPECEVKANPKLEAALVRYGLEIKRKK